jgi:sulfur carrier protein ThiS
MHVTAKLFATLGRFRPGELPGTPFGVELAEGETIGGLLERIGVPAGEVKVVFVNGRTQPPDYVLHPADEVGIFPPVGGG